MEGDLGEEGLEKWENNLEAVVLFWVISFGLLGVDEEGVVGTVATEVRHRRPRPGLSGRGVDGLEKKPNLELIRGLWASLAIRLESVSCLGMDAQNALLHPVIVF